MAVILSPLVAKAQEEKLRKAAEASIGAEQSKLLRDEMNKITHGKRLPGSTLEGASRVLTGLLGAYHGGQVADQEKIKREAVLASLEGRDMTDLERMLVAQGDAGTLKSLSGEGATNRGRAADMKTSLSLEALRGEKEKVMAKLRAELAARNALQSDQRAFSRADATAKRDYFLKYGTPMPDPSARAPSTQAQAGLGLTGGIAPDGSKIATPGTPMAQDQQPFRGTAALDAERKLAAAEALARAKAKAASEEKARVQAPIIKEKAIGAYRMYDQKTKIMNESISKALNLIGDPSKQGPIGRNTPDDATGRGAAFQSALPDFMTTQKYRDLRETLGTIIAISTVDELMAMKEASKTGATGFGQLNTGERMLIEKLKGSFAQGQKAEYIIENLRRLRALHHENASVARDAIERNGWSLKSASEQGGSSQKQNDSSHSKRRKYDPLTDEMK